MENTPKVSVIMPAYNAEKYIEAAIQSVINQTFINWELIIIDDGSIDNTVEIVAKLVENDHRVRFLINETNKGVSYTRNRAIEIATGEWIAFLDSDDLWQNDKLEKQLLLTEKYPDMVVCYTASSFINEAGTPYEYVLEAIEQIDYKKLLHKNIMSCSSVMIRSAVMKNIKMPNDRMHEDYFAWLTVLRIHGIAYGINEPLLTYRLCSNSKSSNRIKSAKMLFNTYRAVGYPLVVSVVFVLRYTLYSVKKRYNIYRSIK